MKLPKYKYNPHKFEEITQIEQPLRLHQQEALQSIDLHSKGQIICPCGTGKTYIEIALIVQDMIKKTNEGNNGVYAIISPRLSLNEQLANQLLNFIIKIGLSFDVIFLGNSSFNELSIYHKNAALGYLPNVSNYISTTITSEIEFFATRSKELGRHLVIISTYDSFDRLFNIGKIDIAVFDEAHNSLEKIFKQNITKIKPNIKREYYFTATRKISGENNGMNDLDFYGEVIYDAAPLKMLEAGEIVYPKIQIIQDKEKYHQAFPNNIDMLVKNVIEAFLFHRDAVLEHSYNILKISAKLLVCAGSIQEMNNIYNHPLFRDFVNKEKIITLSVSSENCQINENNKSKSEVIKSIQQLSYEDEAIIFNVDMLTEGIDLPAITGVMPMRNMGKSKTLQVFGRVVRLHPEDRNNIYSGKLEVRNYKNYIKPFGWFIIPKHLSALSNHQEMIQTIKDIVKEYGTPVEEVLHQEKFNVNTTNDDLYPLISPKKQNQEQYDLENIVLNINISIWRDEFNKSTNKKSFIENKLEGDNENPIK